MGNRGGLSRHWCTLSWQAAHCCAVPKPVGPGAHGRSPQAGLGWGWEWATRDSASGRGAGLGVAPRQVFERGGVKPPGAGGPGSRTLRSVLMKDEGPRGSPPWGEGAALRVQQQEGPALHSGHFSLEAAGPVLRGRPGSDPPLTSSLNRTRLGSSSQGLVLRGARQHSSLTPEPVPSRAGPERSCQRSGPDAVTAAPTGWSRSTMHSAARKSVGKVLVTRSCLTP